MHEKSESKGHLSVGDLYYSIRDSLPTTELILLRILNFCLDIPLPYSNLMLYMKDLWVLQSKEDERRGMNSSGKRYWIHVGQLIIDC